MPSAVHAAAADRTSSGHGASALVHEPLRDHHLASVEQVVALGRDSHVRGVATHVGPDGGEQQDLVLQRGHRVDDHRQRVVVDDDEVGGVLTLVGPFRDHRGDRFADVADDLARERAGREHRRVRRRLRREPELVGGEDADDAGLPERLRGVDAGDPRVRHRRSHVGHVQGSVEERVGDVADEGRRAGQEARVLHPDDPVAEDAHSIGDGITGSPNRRLP